MQSLAKFFASSTVFSPAFKIISAISVDSKDDKSFGSLPKEGRNDVSMAILFFSAAFLRLSAIEELSSAEIDETRIRFFPLILFSMYSNSFSDISLFLYRGIHERRWVSRYGTSFRSVEKYMWLSKKLMKKSMAAPITIPTRTIMTIIFPRVLTFVCIYSEESHIESETSCAT